MSNPTLLVENFNGSLGAFTGVDPIRYDDGLWIEEAGTNLLANASAESNASSNTSAAAATVTRDLTEQLDGAASFKVVTNGVGFNEGIGLISSTGLARVGVTQTFPGVIRLKGSGTVNVWTRITYTDASSTNTANTLATLTSEWQEFTPAIPTSDNAKTIDSVTIWARTNVIQSITFWADAGQVDDNKTYRTSYIYGSKGAGYGFVGTAHLSASTRAASSASVPTAGILNPVSGALAFRLTPTIETGLEEIWGQCGVKGAGTDHMQWGRDATKHPFVEWSANDAAYQRLTATETVDADTEHFFYFGHDGTATSLQVDAGTLQTGTRAAVSASFGAGELTLQASAGGVIVSPFATFDRLLTSAEIATLAPRQNWSLGTLNPATGLRFASFQLRPIGA